MSHPLLKFLAQVGISAVALVVLMRMGSPAQAFSTLMAATPSYVLIAIAAWGVIQGMCILKWQWVNRLQGVDVPLGPLTSAYLIGMFFNTFLPSSFGGDAIRAYKLARYSGTTGRSVGSVVIDRYLALHSLLAVSAVAMLFSPDMRAAASWQVVLASLILGSLPFGLPWLLGLHPLAGWRTRWPVLRQVADSLAGTHASRRLLAIWLLAIAIQYLNALMHYFLILAIGQAVSLPYVLAFVPVMVLLSSLPISVNGLGIREGALVLFLGKVGISAPQALAVGVLSLAMLLLVGAVGAIVYWLDGARLAKAAPAPAQE